MAQHLDRFALILRAGQLGIAPDEFDSLDELDFVIRTATRKQAVIAKKGPLSRQIIRRQVLRGVSPRQALPTARPRARPPVVPAPPPAAPRPDPDPVVVPTPPVAKAALQLEGLLENEETGDEGDFLDQISMDASGFLGLDPDRTLSAQAEELRPSMPFIPDTIDFVLGQGHTAGALASERSRQSASAAGGQNIFWRICR